VSKQIDEDFHILCDSLYKALNICRSSFTEVLKRFNDRFQDNENIHVFYAKNAINKLLSEVKSAAILLETVDHSSSNYFVDTILTNLSHIKNNVDRQVYDIELALKKINSQDLLT
jgi:hypothetical protein